MALAKGHSSKTKSQVSDIRTIGPVVGFLTHRLILFAPFMLVHIEVYIKSIYLSRVMRKPAMWFPNRSDTNRAVQAQQMARGRIFLRKPLCEFCLLTCDLCFVTNEFCFLNSDFCLRCII